MLKGVQQEVEVENEQNYFEVLHAPNVKEAKETEHWLCTQKERDLIYKSVRAKDKSGF